MCLSESSRHPVRNRPVKGGCNCETGMLVFRVMCSQGLTVQYVLVNKFGGKTSATACGCLFLSRRSQKVVAKVNNVCYYEFARYIKAIDTGDFLRGLVMFC